ncbi:hypothetical protein [Streptomyces sp. NPDC058861]|uniref:hypothetical protein n=1 Tax=Streptomyces sp. NPDC058861 TaxID=3346653 RepID=UPI0036750D6C
MALPEIRTWNHREVVTADQFNEQVRDVARSLTNPPYAICTRDSVLPVTGGTNALIPWTSAETSGITTNSSAGYVTGLRVQEAGLYWVDLSLCGRVTDSGIAHFQAYIKVNGNHAFSGTTTAEADGFQDSAYASGLLRLNANDVVTVEVYVTAGRSAEFAEGPWQAYTCRLHLYWSGGF